MIEIIIRDKHIYNKKIYQSSLIIIPKEHGLHNTSILGYIKLAKLTKLTKLTKFYIIDLGIIKPHDCFLNRNLTSYLGCHIIEVNYIDIIKYFDDSLICRISENIVKQLNLLWNER